MVAKPRASVRRASTVSSRLDDFHLDVSPRAYACIWWLVVTFHVVHAGAVLRAVYSLYRTVKWPLRVTTLLRCAGVVYDSTISIVGIACALLVVAYHLYDLGRLVRVSLRSRELRLLGAEPSSPRKRRRPHVVGQRPRRWPLHHVTDLLDGLHGRLYKWQRLCSIRGPYFEAAFHARELLEIGLQTFQAYRVSAFVAHPWANQLALAVIVLNCWSSPVIYWLHAEHLASRRVWCLAIDVLLDFTSSMVIPYSIYITYRRLLAQEDFYDPRWVLEAAYDLQQFTNSNVVELLYRISAAASMILSLQAIQPLIRRGVGPGVGLIAPTQSTPSSSVSSQSQPRPSMGFASLFQSPPQPSPSPLSTSTVVTVSSAERSRHRWVRALHGVLVVYGLAGAGVFLAASARADITRDGPGVVAGCHLAMRQWFAPRYPCAVLELNCHARGLRGHPDELAGALAEVDPGTLAALTISHCPELTMPALPELPYLVWLELYNSTLVDWPREAALYRRTTPRLSRVLLIRVRALGAFPMDALLGSRDRPPPPLLREFVIVASHFASLPPDDDDGDMERWSRPLAALVWEDGKLGTVPGFLARTDVRVLSLAFNALTTAPAWLFHAQRQYTALSLAGNPLTTLPTVLPEVANASSLGSAAAVTTVGMFVPLVDSTVPPRGLHLELTAIAALPPWAHAVGLCERVDLFAYSTPLCDGVAHGPRTCGAFAHCAPPSSPLEPLGRVFPLALHDARRRIE